MNLDILAKKHAIEILLMVRRNPGMPKTWYMGIGSKTPLIRFTELEAEGLIEIVRIPHHNTHRIILTRRGIMVADALRAMKEI